MLAIISKDPLVVYAPTAKFADFIKYTCEIAERRRATIVGYVTPGKWNLIVEKMRDFESKQKLSGNERFYLEALQRLIDLKNRGSLIVSPDVRDFVDKLKSIIEEITGVKLNCPR